MKFRRLAFLWLGLLSLAGLHPALAQWSGDSIVNNLVCDAPDTQATPFLVSDGAGGVIILWNDRRSGLDYDIYAQHLSSSGIATWTSNGVAVCSAPKNQRSPFGVPDGAGGAIVAWFDFRSDTADIYAQRINSRGVAQWTANGVVICNAADDQRVPHVARSGSGNTIIAWQDRRNGTDYDIYAQRVNGSGSTLWTSNGVAICTAAGDQDSVRLISDGAGGAIMVWQDRRNGADYDVYAQRVATTGTPLWTTKGVAIATGSGDQLSPRIATDGAGGAIIVWQDFRNGSDFDIYAQHIDSSGSVLWAANGVPLSTAGGNQISPVIESDGAGGAVASWADRRNGSDYDIYAQRIDATGGVKWAVNGVPIGASAFDQVAPRIGTDGSGGAYLVWEDWGSGSASHIYAQHVDSAGAVRWAMNGTGICIAANNQEYANMESGGLTGFTVAWQDFRNGTDFNIFAQHVNADGSLGGTTGVQPASSVPAAFGLYQNYPNPFNPATAISYELSAVSFATLKVYDILGREVTTLVSEVKQPGKYTVRWDGTRYASGVYLCRLEAIPASGSRNPFIASKRLMLLK